jgi:hypothetical protein
MLHHCIPCTLANQISQTMIQQNPLIEIYPIFMETCDLLVNMDPYLKMLF